jgi:hypothetical protein
VLLLSLLLVDEPAWHCNRSTPTAYHVMNIPAMRSFITRLSLRLGPTNAWPLRTNSRGSVYSHPVKAVFKASPIEPWTPGTCSSKVHMRQAAAGVLHEGWQSGACGVLLLTLSA